jgi:hypothetical protein
LAEKGINMRNTYDWYFKKIKRYIAR